MRLRWSHHIVQNDRRHLVTFRGNPTIGRNIINAQLIQLGFVRFQQNIITHVVLTDSIVG